jgi:ketosteroid isomerase-like protein
VIRVRPKGRVLPGRVVDRSRGVARAAPAERLTELLIPDARACERSRQRLGAELGVAARAGVAADVGDELDAGLVQKADEDLDRMRRVTNSENLALRMSRERVDLVRSLIPPPDVDLVSLVRDEAAFEHFATALESIIDPEIETVAVWQGGAARVFIGLDGVRQLWLDRLEPWASYRSQLEEVIDAGDRVVVLVRDRARRHGSDAEVELLAGSVWEFRDGRIARIEFFGSQAEALATIGLRR